MGKAIRDVYGETLAELDAATLTYTDSGLEAERYYTYTLYALGDYRQQSTGLTCGGRTGAGADETPTTVPTGLAFSSADSEPPYTLTWSRSTDNTGVTGYAVTVDGEEYARSYNRHLILSGLMPDEHSATVSALDGAGNRSAESEALRFTVVSALVDPQLSYNKAKDGSLIDTTLSFSAGATGDVTAMRAEVTFIDNAGEEGCETAELFSGTRWTGLCTLPDTAVQVTGVTLRAYGEGGALLHTRELLDKAVTRAVTVTVYVDLGIPGSDAAAFDSSTVTLHNDSTGTSQSVEISGVSGNAVFNILPGSRCYMFLTGPGGERIASWSSGSSVVNQDTAITWDCNTLDLHLFTLDLSSWVNINMQGVKAEVLRRDGTVLATGTADENGHITWNGGGTKLICPANITVHVPPTTVLTNGAYVQGVNEPLESRSLVDVVRDTTEEMTLTKTEEKKNMRVIADEYWLEAVKVHVEDEKGMPIRGVEVNVAAYSQESAVTGSAGNAEATVILDHTGKVKVSVPGQTDPQGASWAAVEAETATDTCTIVLTRKYNTLTVKPTMLVKQADGNTAPLEESEFANLNFFVFANGKPLTEKGGVYSSAGLYLSDGDTVTFAYEGRDALGNLRLTGTGKTTFRRLSPAIAPTVTLDTSSVMDVTVRLEDTEPIWREYNERKFIVFDGNGEMVDQRVTDQASVVFYLDSAESYTVVGTWDTAHDLTLEQWKTFAREKAGYGTVDAASGSTTMVLNATASHPTAVPGLIMENPLFWQENGFSGNGVTGKRLANGNVYYHVRYNLCSDNYKEVNAYLQLPANANLYYLANGENIIAYQRDDGFMRIKKPSSAVDGKIGVVVEFGLELSQEDARNAEKIYYWFSVEHESGKKYVSPMRSFPLVAVWTEAGGPSVIGSTTLKTEGYPLTVSCPGADSDWTITVYDGDHAVASQRATGENTFLYVPADDTLGTHRLRAVAEKDGARQETSLEFEVVDDRTPELKGFMVNYRSAYGTYWKNGAYYEWKNWYTYSSSSPGGSGSPYAISYKDVGTAWFNFYVRMSNAERVDKVVAVVTMGGNDKEITLKRRPVEELIPVDDWTQIGDAGDGDFFVGSISFSALQKSVTEIGLYYTVKSSWELPQASIKLPEPATYEEAVYAAPHEGESQGRTSLAAFGDEDAQQQAIADWEKFVRLTENGPYNTDAAKEAALAELFGEDGRWELPAIQDEYGNHFRMSFEQSPEKEEAALGSVYALNILVNGEQRKITVRYYEDEGYARAEYYGVADLFFPRVTRAEDDSVSGAGLPSYVGSLGGYSVNNGTNVAVEYATNQAINAGESLIGAGIDALQATEQMPDGFTHNDRYNQIENSFNKANQLAKDVGNGLNDLATFTGMGDMGMTDFASQALLGENGVLDQLTNIQKGRIHAIDELMLQMGSDIFTEEQITAMMTEDGIKIFKTGVKVPCRFLIDPSGNIYEAVETQPVEGVSASIRYWDEDADQWVLWDSEAYGQPSNPMYSMEDGYYGWDVLEGLWQVTFEKDGYYTAYSTELEVPPPHMDVNISLVSTEAPAVEALTALAAGDTLYLDFDRYMRADELTEPGAVTVLFGGEEADFTITAPEVLETYQSNKQAESDWDVPAGLPVAKRFVLTLADPVPTGAALTVLIRGDRAAYNGMSLGADQTLQCVVPERDPDPVPTALTLEDTDYTLAIGETLDLAALTALEGGDGTLTWESSIPGVATVSDSGLVTALAAGDTTVTVSCGELTATVLVNVNRGARHALAENNAVVLSRETGQVGQELVIYSHSARLNAASLMAGDTSYFPVSWRILENGTVVREGDVAQGLTAVTELYTPVNAGTLRVEITYQNSRFNGLYYEPVAGDTYTARKEIPVGSSKFLTVIREGSTLTCTCQFPADGSGASVIAAWYGDQGQMLGCRTETVTCDGPKTITFSDVPDAKSYKVFVIDAATGQPLCESWREGP